ncbi:MAG: tryptophan-rich sensory protein [Clostridia bacterium]|nr:tryptophan-rich sensory protein [Clostridia bacterium]
MAVLAKPVQWKKLLLYIGGTFAFAGVSALLGMPDFEGLVKPPLTPPQWVFPVVWSILYLLMGYAAYRIAVSGDSGASDALRMYWIQLAINALWTFFFFRLDWRLFAFFWLLLLIVLIVRTVTLFQEIDRIAARLLYPYLAWCAFAAYLNLAFWLINR